VCEMRPAVLVGLCVPPEVWGRASGPWLGHAMPWGGPRLIDAFPEVSEEDLSTWGDVSWQVKSLALGAVFPPGCQHHASF
jgi:hypothetical protein